MNACEKRLDVLNTELSRIVDVLVNNCNPQKIFLLGSLAIGNVNESSDSDIIVIKEAQVAIGGSESRNVS